MRRITIERFGIYGSTVSDVYLDTAAIDGARVWLAKGRTSADEPQWRVDLLVGEQEFCVHRTFAKSAAALAAVERYLSGPTVQVLTEANRFVVLRRQDVVGYEVLSQRAHDDEITYVVRFYTRRDIVYSARVFATAEEAREYAITLLKDEPEVHGYEGTD